MLSYVRGPDVPLLRQTIDEVFRRTAERFAERPALIVRHQDIRLTWKALDAEVDKVARGLKGLGLASGDRVGVWAPNGAEWVLLQLACARAHLVFVNINTSYRSYELRYVLARSGMKALFLWEADERAGYRRILEEASEGQELALRHIVYLGQDGWRALLDSGGELPSEPIDVGNIANLQYTSGTTGSPKGVLLTHHNLVNNGLVIASGFQATEQDSICVPVPLFHCFGSVIGSMTWIVCGATMVLPAARFCPRATLEAIHAERCTIVYGVPAMFIAELDQPEFSQFDLTSLRTGMMAGAPCPVEIMRRVISDMHCTGITIGYGQTESTPIITMSKVDDPVETRVTTVGAAMSNTEVKIVSPEGETVPLGKQGELCTRGYLVMKGYDQDREATSRAIDPEGWLHTGDLAAMRSDGYLKITGRAKDLIIRGGENISPREVEEFLHTHPKVAEVQVVGLPDRRFGESVACWVRLRAGETATEHDIREFCRGKIAHFKVPQFVRFVDAFPMTVSGKVQKYRMREIEIQERGLEGVAKTEMA